MPNFVSTFSECVLECFYLSFGVTQNTALEVWVQGMLLAFFGRFGDLFSFFDGCHCGEHVYTAQKLFRKGRLCVTALPAPSKNTACVLSIRFCAAVSLYVFQHLLRCLSIMNRNSVTSIYTTIAFWSMQMQMKFKFFLPFNNTFFHLFVVMCI